jgi:nucleoside phosphorylase
MDRAPVHLIAALPAEVKPLISRFNLERVQPDRVFPVYRNRHLSLVVSGVGKVNAAAASAFLYALNGFPNGAVWINLGIAGHKDLPLGDAVLAHRITDAASGRQWHPPLAIHAPCKTVGLETLDEPNFDYPRDSAFDMEASGFYATAVRFSRAELVQCLKVISDNGDSPGHGIDAATVRRLIGAKLALLEALIVGLGALTS